MCFLGSWHGDAGKVGISLARNGLLVERVPCYVNLGNMVQVPAQTSGNGTDGGAFYQYLAILASDNKDFLLGVKGGVKHKPELAGTACTANTFYKGNNGIGIADNLHHCIDKVNGFVLLVNCNAPCVTWYFCSREQLCVKFALLEYCTCFYGVSVVGYAIVLSLRSIYGKGVVYGFTLLIQDFYTEGLGIHGCVLRNKRKRESTAKINILWQGNLEPVILCSVGPCACTICSVYTVKHVCKDLAVVVACEAGFLQFNLIARCIEQFKRIETHALLAILIVCPRLGQGKAQLVARFDKPHLFGGKVAPAVFGRCWCGAIYGIVR